MRKVHEVQQPNARNYCVINNVLVLKSAVFQIASPCSLLEPRGCRIQSCRTQQVPLKFLYNSIRLHDLLSQKSSSSRSFWPLQVSLNHLHLNNKNDMYWNMYLFPLTLQFTYTSAIKRVKTQINENYIHRHCCHTLSIIKGNLFMLHREIFFLCSEIRTKHNLLRKNTNMLVHEAIGL